MIRAEKTVAGRPGINPLAGEFAVLVAGTLCRFDTRLSTVAAVEAACGDRAIADILNGIIVTRRARDVIPVLATMLATLEPPPDPEALAARASVGEAEAFMLALIFALGFSVRRDRDGGAGGDAQAPLDGAPGGGSGAPSRSAP